MGQPTADQPKKEPFNEAIKSPTKPLVLFTSICAGILFVLVIAVPSGGFIPLAGAVCIVLSVIFNVAAWSVLGPGSYLKRLLIAHLIGLIPAIGAILGAVVVFYRQGLWGMNMEEQVLSFLILSLIPTSVACQLVFWIFRGFLGWQFVFDGEAPNQRFQLRDIFTLTFVIALAFTIPGITSHLFEGQAAGWEAEQQTISDAEVQRQANLLSYAAQGRGMVMAFVLTLFSSPIPFFVFRFHDDGRGCFFIFLYALVPTALFFVGGSFLAGSFPPPQPVFFGLTFMMSTYFALAIPMMILRENGVRLTNERATAHESPVTEKSFDEIG